MFNSSINKKSVLVIGDVMIDYYYKGVVSRISPEAPVPVFLKKSERCVLGGASNVAANLAAANQKVSLMSVIGEDDNGLRLLTLLGEKGIDTKLVARIKRPTTIKTRFLAENNQQLLRMDVEDSTEVADVETSEMMSAFKNMVESFDLIILSDYMKGLLTYSLCQQVLEIARRSQIPVLVDVKDSRVAKYRGATLLKPNRKELHLLTGMSVNSDEEIIKAAEYLKDKCECKYVLATLGAKGMLLVGDGDPYFLPAETREVYDVSGAGDTTIAYLSASMANKIAIRDAMKVANYAAGIQVGKVGTSSISLQEVRDSLSKEDDGDKHKILPIEEVGSFRRNNASKKIVFTNGCFDILHVGHKRYLQQAATLGDILIVGLNSDASVRRLKGPSRPINNEQDRAEMLSALSFIDYVTIFDEDTPYELIKKIQPDVLVKGGDYKPDEVVGKDIVEARGGRLELISFVEGKSTTNIINKINQK